MKSVRGALVVCGTIVLAVMVTAQAWHGPAHTRATRLAVGALPGDVPAVFRKGLETVAHCSRDPDLFRLPVHPELRNGEVPEHYFDLELLAGARPPPTRYGFVQLCAKKGLKPEKVGLLPYAVVEWTQRLRIAFAEHRKWPGNKHIQAKALVYAGMLAHYAQDACQPLHTTIHYDGRAKPDGTSPRTGIHNKLDALIQKLKTADKPLARRVKPARYEQLFPAVMGEIRKSHALVEKVYELEKQLPALDKPIPAGSAVERFAIGRMAACANFTASLYLTAWRTSVALELPDWHKREAR